MNIVGNSGLPTIYDGEDEEHDMEDFKVEDIYRVSDKSESKALESCPSIYIELDKYPAIWKPWQRALILKVLGFNVRFHILKQCIKDLWELPLVSELIDLEQGYVVA